MRRRLVFGFLDVDVTKFLLLSSQFLKRPFPSRVPSQLGLRFLPVAKMAICFSFMLLLVLLLLGKLAYISLLLESSLCVLRQQIHDSKSNDDGDGGCFFIFLRLLFAAAADLFAITMGNWVVSCWLAKAVLLVQLFVEETLVLLMLLLLLLLVVFVVVLY
jgi:hypothetical protein